MRKEKKIHLPVFDMSFACTATNKSRDIKNVRS